MTTDDLIKKYRKAHNDENPKCYVCEKEIDPLIDYDFEYVKQKSGKEIFMHKRCFEKRFLGK